MRITDELREWMYGHTVNCSDNRIALAAIAGRIDAEHEKAVNAFERDMGMEPMTDENMAKHGWIRLPVDADGVPIHVGDRLDGYGKTIEVVEIRHGRSGWVVISRDGNGYADTFAFTHHRPPTVEDILREFAERVGDGLHTIGAMDTQVIIAEYAAKLRLAGEDA